MTRMHSKALFLTGISEELVHELSWEKQRSRLVYAILVNVIMQLRNLLTSFVEERMPFHVSLVLSVSGKK